MKTTYIFYFSARALVSYFPTDAIKQSLAVCQQQITILQMFAPMMLMKIKTGKKKKKRTRPEKVMLRLTGEKTRKD